METWIDKVWGIVMVYGMRIVAAIAIFVVGRWIAKGLTRGIERLMEKSDIDPMLVKFICNVSYVGLLTFVVLAVLGQLGIQTTSFIAVLGAAGLAIGLALQGSLSNFAAGFLMILFRPFKLGDFIEGAGVAGTVEEIQIFTTKIGTVDNKTVIIPNAKLTDGNIVNWTVKGTRRVDLVFRIGYGDNIDKAKQVLAETVAKDSRVLPNPATTIAVSELAESSVNIAVRPWVKTDDYWDVYSTTIENVKKALDAAGFSIPLPQRDVHVYEHRER